MKRFLCLALVLALGLAACGKEKESSDTQSVDLRAEYEAGIKQVQDELGDNAPVLLEETAVELLNSYYPGLENAKLKQGVFFISPTATSCEVSMVEAPAYTDGEGRRFVAYSVIAPAAGVRSTPPGSFAAPIAARGR